MTVLKEGAAIATMGSVMGVMTVVFLASMVAWIAWTWWPSRAAMMEAASRLPLEDD